MFIQISKFKCHRIKIAQNVNMRHNKSCNNKNILHVDLICFLTPYKNRK